MLLEAIRPTVCADDEAMRRIAAGDSDALAVLFDRHKARLLGFLCHLVGDAAAAEDLVSEAFLRVHRAGRRYRPGSGFTPWLYSIARNLARGELRKRAVQNRARERLAREWSETESAAAPELDDTQERVQAALQTLPEEQRSAVVLKEYLGMEYREVARVLGCTEQAARARTYRGRQALREALREWWEERSCPVEPGG